MKFYEALKECIENGKRITRSDWNGKDQYVWFVPPHKVCIENFSQDVGIPNDPTDAERIKGYVEIQGHFDMMNAQGKRIIGWLASQTDMYSDKWEIL